MYSDTRGRRLRTLVSASAIVSLVLIPGAQSYGQDVDVTPSEVKVLMDTLWVMVAGFLVFFMNAGFALVESGFCRSKNTVNILAKNFIVFAIAAIAYWTVGFAFMFGEGSGLIGWHGLFLSGADNSPAVGDAYKGVYSSLNWVGVPLEAKFFFQLAFAATAATIVSGAVAERIKFQAYILFAALLAAVIYPVSGHWVWGGGYLASMGFHDFAGSTVVHSAGGWAALVGAIMLGPRLGKYSKETGKVQPIPGHNMAMATLGGLILWFGWFGFNPGSTMAASPDIALVAVTTALAASAGVAGACTYAWLRVGTPDLSMIINGSLAGLVAITAPCWVVTPFGSLVIGLTAGVLVVESVIAFDKLHIDDPVGALSVHLVNGIWGTLCVGLFAAQTGAEEGIVGLFYGGGLRQLGIQAAGIAAVAIFTSGASLLSWGLVKAVVGLRVSPDEEYLGLDMSEMGLEAYPEDATTRLYAAAKEA
jgi:ammonium transporter, Amt family